MITKIRDLKSCPILDYWEQIKDKPLWQAAEQAERAADLLKEKAKAGENAVTPEELEHTLLQLAEARSKIQKGSINASDKVWRIYKHLAGICRGESDKWEYDGHKASHAINFIQTFCRHSKGKAGGKPFELESWQLALVAAMFGIVVRGTGKRRFQEVLLIVARKNGKSTLAAAIGLYLMVADGEAGAEIYACATKKDQAKLIWLEAKRMVRKSAALNKRIKTLTAEITCDANDSFFKPLGRDSDTLDGLNVHGALMDELAAWTDDNLYDVVVDGDSAREEPMIFMTTTAGTVREHIYDTKYADAGNLIKMLDVKGAEIDEQLLPVIYELDERAEWQYEICYIKANPGLGTIKQRDTLAAKVRKAKINSKLVKNLLCKDFDIPDTSISSWLSYEDANNEATFDVKVLRPKYGIYCADLSSTTDLTSAHVLFKTYGDPTIYDIGMYWLPAACLDKRVEEDKIPYDLWVEQGLMRLSEGNKVDYRDVTAWFVEVQSELDIYPAFGGHDAWSATYWVNDMADKFGPIMEPVAQTIKVLSEPMKRLGADLESKLINYNNNPVTKWCLCNVSKIEDKNGNIKPAKGTNPRYRIDGFAAMLDGYVKLLEKQEEYDALVG